MNTLLGLPISYWVELKALVERQEGAPQLEKVIAENAILRAKVSFCEQQAREAATFLGVVNDLK